MNRPLVFLFAIFLSVLTISCKKDKRNSSILSGIYKGTFQRSYSNVVSSVTLNLSSKRFTGESQQHHYPAICNGSFSVAQDSVSFVNDCIFTADFDWNYILSGKFKLLDLGDSLFIKREYNGTIFYFDVYKLKKQ